jgi:acetylornithine deacetylase/succinyl-diaminopimelate desuccinylase-like protein
MDVLELLRALVAIPSVNPFKFASVDGAGLFDQTGSPFVSAASVPAAVGFGTEQAIHEYIEQYLRSCGFEVERQYLHPELRLRREAEDVIVPARWNILATKQCSVPRAPSILLFGHTDTVDVKQGWESDPFQITARSAPSPHRGERWYALGANDMKGGLAAILAAARDFSPHAFTLKLAFLVDEEFYSLGAEALCRSSFLSGVSLALVPEIGDGAVDDSEQWIGLGRLGRNEYEFTVVGKACHGADAFIRPDAINAVHEALALELDLVTYCSEARATYKGPGTELLDREVINSLYLSHHSGGDGILSVPDSARVILDRTFLPDESPPEELQRLQERIDSLFSRGLLNPNTKVTIRERPRPTPPCKPYVWPPSLPAVQVATELIRRHAPRTSYGIGRSVADENRLSALGIPTLIVGPVGAGSHTNEEWVSPASVQRLDRIFREVLRYPDWTSVCTHS